MEAEQSGPEPEQWSAVLLCNRRTRTPERDLCVGARVPSEVRSGFNGVPESHVLCANQREAAPAAQLSNSFESSRSERVAKFVELLLEHGAGLMAPQPLGAE